MSNRMTNISSATAGQVACRVRLQVFGAFRIIVDGRDLRLRTRKEAMLLLRLAMAGDGGIRRDECLALLWPDSPEVKARHSLSEALRGIELATGLQLHRDPDRVALRSGSTSLDAADLNAAILQGDVTMCTEIYKGAFLAGWYPPTAEASHWADGVGAAIAHRLEKMLRRELAVRRQATDARGVLHTVGLLKLLGAETNEDREAGAEAEQVVTWESLRPGDRVQSRLPLDREGPFVGRVAEMRLLTLELERAMAGELRVVLVSGEAGIGKTRTCQRLARLAALRGARLFMSTCYELEQSVSYGTITDLLSALTSADIRDIKPGYRHALSAVLPRAEFAAEGAPDIPTKLGSRVILEAIAAAFNGVCKRIPALFLVDDLQWADSTSCQVLHFLLRGLDGSLPSAIILSFRPDELSTNPSALALVRNAENLGAHLLELDSVPEGDLAAQIAALCPSIGERKNEIAAMAAGNPFFARELALAQASTEEVRSISDTILSRTRVLGRDEELVLDAVAVAGVPLTVDELLTITGVQSSSSLLRGVSRLEKARLLQETDGAINIAHDLIRVAVYNKLSTTHRRYLHAAAAEALHHRGNAALLAHHYSMAGLRRHTRRMALRAAKASRAVRDYREEIGFLKLALDNAESHLTAGIKKVTSRMLALGRFADAVELLDTKEEFLDSTLRVRRLVAGLKQLTVADVPEAYTECDAVFEKCVTAGADSEAAEALREKMRLAQETANNAVVLETAARLQQFGRDCSDITIGGRARAFALLKLTSYGPEAVSEGLAELRQDLSGHAGLIPSDLQTTLDHVDALNNYNQGNLIRAGVILNKTIRKSRYRGDLLLELRARSLLVPISTEAGRFTRARKHAQFVTTYSRYGDAFWEHAVAAVNYAALLLELGDFRQARAIAADGLDLQRDRPMWAAMACFYSIIGMCDLAIGDLDAAGAALANVSRQLPPPEDWVSDLSLPVIFMSKALEGFGREREANALLEMAVEHAETRHRMFYWTVRLELAEMRIRRGLERDLEEVAGIRDEAAAKGGRLVVRKACEVLGLAATSLDL